MKSKGEKLLEQRNKRNNYIAVILKKKPNVKETEILLAAEEEDVPCVEADVWNKKGSRGAL